MVVNASINSSHDHIQYSNSSHDSLSSNAITMSSLSDYENASANNCDTNQMNSLNTASTPSSKTSPSPYSFRKRSNQNSNSSSPLKIKSTLPSNFIETIASSISHINGFDNDSLLTSNTSTNISTEIVIDNTNGSTHAEIDKSEPIQNEEYSEPRAILPSKRRSCTPASFNIKQMFAYEFTAKAKPKRSKSRLKDQSIKSEDVANGVSLDSNSIIHNSKRSRQIEKCLPDLTVTTTVKETLSIDLPSPISPSPTIKAADLHQILNTTPPSKIFKHSSHQCPHNLEWCRPNPYLYPWEQRSQKISANARRALFLKSTFNDNESGGFHSSISQTHLEETKNTKRTSNKRNKEILNKSHNTHEMLHEPHYFGYRMTRDGKKEFLVTWESDDDQ